MTPDGWRPARFGDVASLEYGKSLPASHRKGGTVAVCGSNGIIGYHAEPLVDGPGIVVGRKGSVGVVTWIDSHFWPIDTTYYVSVLEDAYTRWLYYAVSHLRLERLNEATGIPGLNRNTAAALKLDLPPLPEQHKIAAILSSVDDAIEKTQAVIDQVQVVKRGLMQELLTWGLPGRHTRFKQTEIGEIPADWRIVRVGQIGAVEAGRQRSPWAKGERRPYLRVANVYDGYIDTTSVLSMPFTEREFSRYKLALGDLLLNEGQSRELVGRCAEYAGYPPECCFQNTLVRFQAGDQVTARFAFWVFRHYFYSGVFSDIARQTTSVAHLGVRRFADVMLALPSLAEQVKITENIEMIGSREDSERDKLGQLSVVKSALMSVLLTGELRVTTDPATP